jgi:hypothetical protein
LGEQLVLMLEQGLEQKVELLQEQFLLGLVVHFERNPDHVVVAL